MVCEQLLDSASLLNRFVVAIGYILLKKSGMAYSLALKAVIGYQITPGWFRRTESIPSVLVGLEARFNLSAMVIDHAGERSTGEHGGADAPAFIAGVPSPPLCFFCSLLSF